MDESSLGDKNNFEYRCSLVGAGHEILVAVVNHDQGWSTGFTLRIDAKEAVLRREHHSIMLLVPRGT